MSQPSHNSCNVSETTWYEHERQPATMQFENDKNTLNKSHVRILFFFFSYHAVWDECNKKVHHQPKETPIKTRPKKKSGTGRGSDLWYYHLRSRDNTSLQGVCFAHWAHRAVWFSTDKHLHTNATVTNLSICPFSHGRKQREYYRNVEGYCYGSCQVLQHQTPSMTSNYSNTGASLAASQCKIT